MNKIIMQGDIQLEPCEEPKNVSKIFIGKEYVLKHGESGNKHTVSSPQTVEVYKNEQGEIFVRLKGVGLLTHETHGTHEVAPSWYRLNDEQEYDYFGNSVRRVID